MCSEREFLAPAPGCQSRTVPGLAGSVRRSLFGMVLVLPILVGTGAAALEPVKSLLETRQDRVVMQQWDVSCGAAVLATILTYQHDDPVSEREVARVLVSRHTYLADPPDPLLTDLGFSLLDLKRYVESRGYEGIGYGRLSLDDLVRHAPIIVPVDMLGYPHFVVFRGMQGSRVLLADPAWGNRTMTRDRFEAGWLDYGEVGRVGFVVLRPDQVEADHGLAPDARDFVRLR